MDFPFFYLRRFMTIILLKQQDILNTNEIETHPFVEDPLVDMINDSKVTVAVL